LSFWQRDPVYGIAFNTGVFLFLLGVTSGESGGEDVEKDRFFVHGRAY
jgi:hypothetical protein